MINRLLRSLSYFRSGFSNYINYPFTLISFGTTFYYLAIQNMPQLKTVFPGFLEFMIATTLIVYPLGHLLGWLHYKKLLFPVEQDINVESNPYSQYKLTPVMIPMWKAIIAIAEKEGLDVKEMHQILEQS